MIHPTAVIGSPPEHRDWQEGDKIHRPLISSRARINAFVTVDGGLKARTYVGEAFVMAHCHIGHDAQVHNGCELAPGTVIGGHAILEDGVRCGIGVLVKPYVRVGQGARLGAGAVVVKDVPPGEVWVGNPARKLEKATGEQMTRAEEDGWNEWWDKSRTSSWMGDSVNAEPVWWPDMTKPR